MNVRRMQGEKRFLHYIGYAIPRILGAGRMRLSYMVADTYFLTCTDD